jgi:hypothetical protein
MTRTTIMLPEALKRRAIEEASRRASLPRPRPTWPPTTTATSTTSPERVIFVDTGPSSADIRHTISSAPPGSS